ncbi:FAD-dependent oxidoreductase [Mycobacterium sp. URHB0021]|jgi:2-polyprenyl-6-methoxyphenol hydroxylase-like FAD-dependent oxidoreductase
MKHLGERAIVVGASIAGLLAARVLADFYDTVILVERDRFADAPQNRRGVPQGRHSHVLMRRGSLAMSELFPGLLEELVASGAPVWEDGDLTKLDFSVAGHRLARHGRFTDLHSTLIYSATRPFVEFHLRRHVLRLSNVQPYQGYDFIDVLVEDDRICGIRAHDQDNGEEALLSADLVVDASGRGSRMPVLLESRGYPRPIEDKLVVRINYSSQLFRLSPIRPPEIAINAFDTLTSTGKGLGWFACENDTSMLTLVGIGAYEPPSDISQMLDVVDELAPPHVAESLRRAEPIGQSARFHTASSCWRRYDKLRGLPKGLVVTGDAYCNFNPVYGQGMTIATLDALALREALASGEKDVARRFFAGAAKATRVAWNMAVSSDLTLPGVSGKPTLAMRWSNWYTDRVLRCAESNPAVAEQFWKVMNLVAPRSELLHPAVLMPVAAALVHPRRRLQHHQQKLA